MTCEKLGDEFAFVKIESFLQRQRRLIDDRFDQYVVHMTNRQRIDVRHQRAHGQVRQAGW